MEISLWVDWDGIMSWHCALLVETDWALVQKFGYWMCTDEMYLVLWYWNIICLVIIV